LSANLLLLLQAIDRFLFRDSISIHSRIDLCLQQHSNLYRLWAHRVDDVLSTPTEENLKDSKWKERDAVAKALLAINMDDSMIDMIMDKNHAYQQWELLQKHFKGKSNTHVFGVIRQLGRLKHSQEQSVVEHATKVKGMLQVMEGISIKIPELVKIGLLLNTLPSSYDSLITVIENQDDQKMTWDNVTTQLMNHEAKIHEKEAVMEETALASSSHGKKSKSKRKQGDTDNKPSCTYCHKPGHIAEKCYSRLRDERKSKAKDKSKTSHAHVAEVNDEDATLATVTDHLDNEEDGLMLAVEKSGEHWFLDSGATSHMCGRRGWFLNLQGIPTRNVYLANNDKIQTSASGDIHVELQGSGEHVLSLNHVLYIPNIGKNLVSVQALTNEGYQFVFRDNQCIISDRQRERSWQGCEASKFSL
jgi:hypothetical protein